MQRRAETPACQSLVSASSCPAASCRKIVRVCETGCGVFQEELRLCRRCPLPSLHFRASNLLYLPLLFLLSVTPAHVVLIPSLSPPAKRHLATQALPLPPLLTPLIPSSHQSLPQAMAIAQSAREGFRSMTVVDTNDRSACSSQPQAKLEAAHDCELPDGIKEYEHQITTENPFLILIQVDRSRRPAHSGRHPDGRVPRSSQSDQSGAGGGGVCHRGRRNTRRAHIAGGIRVNDVT